MLNIHQISRSLRNRTSTTDCNQSCNNAIFPFVDRMKKLFVLVIMSRKKEEDARIRLIFSEFKANLLIKIKVGFYIFSALVRSSMEISFATTNQQEANLYFSQ